MPRRKKKKKKREGGGGGERYDEDQSETEEPLEKRILFFFFSLEVQKHAQETKTETVWSLPPPRPPPNEVRMSFWMNLKFHPKTQPEHTCTYILRSVFQLRGRLAATDG